MERLQTVDADAETIYRSLLVRSGLIREPAEGRVNFIHRTFQEYLGAKEAIDSDHVMALVTRATDDQWQEVVVLAAGHARPPECERLIRGIVERGNTEARNMHRLYLLAIACMETAREMSPELRSELGAMLRSLIPPTTIAEARSLASAGDLVTEALAQIDPGSLLATHAAATVRTLSLVGSEAAMNLLERFGSDRRVTVTRELIRGWSNFEPDAYARRVLANSPLDYGTLTLRDASLVPVLPQLRGLREIRLDLSNSIQDLDGFIPMADLITYVYCSWQGRLSDLRALRSFKSLVRLTLYGCSQIQTLVLPESGHPLTVLLVHCPVLSDISDVASKSFSRLSLEGSRRVSDFTPLGSASCQRLELGNSNLVNLEDIAGCDGLEELGISRTSVRSLEALSSFPGLLGIRADDTEVSVIPSLDGVKLKRFSLHTSSPRSGVDLEPLSSVKTLTNISVSDAEDISPLMGIPQLDTLQLWRYRGAGIGLLAGLGSLSNLTLAAAAHTVDLTALAGAPLKTLNLARSDVVNASAILDIATLKHLVVDSDFPEVVLKELRSRGCTVRAYSRQAEPWA